jgi:hypothetical protein
MQSGRWTAFLFAAFGAALVVLPAPAHAGFFDFFFGGPQQPSPPSQASGYAEPPPRVAPSAPYGSESVRQSSGNTGHGVAFCVRLCDGQHFPLERLTNATAIETCRSMCPASRTKVFYGSEVDSATASDGTRYATLDTAFAYRKRVVPNCTCNGRNVFGLARFDMTRDATLRPGDIVSTKTGFVVYGGKSGQSEAFSPVEKSTVDAQLVPPSARVRLTRRNDSPPADEDPGTITRPLTTQSLPPVVDLSVQNGR